VYLGLIVADVVMVTSVLMMTAAVDDDGVVNFENVMIDLIDFYYYYSSISIKLMKNDERLESITKQKTMIRARNLSDFIRHLYYYYYAEKSSSRILPGHSFSLLRLLVKLFVNEISA
jgi:hypothetical protein